MSYISDVGGGVCVCLSCVLPLLYFGPFGRCQFLVRVFHTHTHPQVHLARHWLTCSSQHTNELILSGFRRLGVRVRVCVDWRLVLQSLAGLHWLLVFFVGPLLEVQSLTVDNFKNQRNLTTGRVKFQNLKTEAIDMKNVQASLRCVGVLLCGLSLFHWGRVGGVLSMPTVEPGSRQERG